MNISRTIWERQKNPWNWVVRLLFFIVLGVGIWMHNIWLLILGIWGVATPIFWFPTRKKTSPWIEAAIDSYRKSFEERWSTAFFCLIFLLLLVFGLWCYTMWLNNVWISLVLFLIMMLVKLYLSREPLRQGWKVYCRRRSAYVPVEDL
jgi:hypothetical protein